MADPSRLRLTPPQAEIPLRPEEAAPCNVLDSKGKFRLCFAQNANVGHRAFDRPISPVEHPMVEPPSDIGPMADHSAVGATQAQANTAPLVRSIPAWRSAPKTSPLAFARKIGLVLGGPLGQAAVAAALLSIKGIEELLAEIDQSGGFVGLQCAAGPKSANAGASLIFEISPQDPTTGERKRIVSVPLVVNLTNPLGLGGGSAGYTFSDADEAAGRDGFHWAARATVPQGSKHQQKVPNSAFQDSVVLDGTLSPHREQRTMGFLDQNSWRGDFAGSIGKIMRPIPRLGPLAEKTDLKCGGAVMVRSPLLGKVSDTVQSTVAGKNAMGSRTSDNGGHSDTVKFLHFLAKTFAH